MDPQYYSNLPVGTRWRHATPGTESVFVKISPTASQCLSGPIGYFMPGNSYVIGESVACRVIPFELRHPGDPKSPPRLWSYVYLHGRAEHWNARVGRQNGWEDCAPDLCCCVDDPLPAADGEYDAILYGEPAKIVLSTRYHGSLFGGRVALTNDEEGLAHARDHANWM